MSTPLTPGLTSDRLGPGGVPTRVDRTRPEVGTEDTPGTVQVDRTEPWVWDQGGTLGTGSLVGPGKFSEREWVGKGPKEPLPSLPRPVPPPSPSF